MSRGVTGKATETLWPEGTLVSVFVTDELVGIDREAEIHRAFELACIVRGKQVRHLPGFHAVMGPGDVCLVPPWEAHSWRTMESHTVALSVHFLPQFLGEEMIGNASWLSLFACPPEQRPRTVDEQMRQEILTFVQFLSRGTPTYTWYERRRLPQQRRSAGKLVQIVYQTVPGGNDLPPAWQEAVRHDLVRILIALYRGWSHRTARTGLANTTVGDLSAVMPAISLTMHGESPVARVSLEHAAEACNLSVTHFRRLFRRTMGITFARFELHQRLAEAERLLHSTDLTLEQIAEKCAFTDASHLSRLFKRLHGHTAAQHRKLTASRTMSDQ